MCLWCAQTTATKSLRSRNAADNAGNRIQYHHRHHRQQHHHRPDGQSVSRSISASRHCIIARARVPIPSFLSLFCASRPRLQSSSSFHRPHPLPLPPHTHTHTAITDTKTYTHPDQEKGDRTCNKATHKHPLGPTHMTHAHLTPAHRLCGGALPL